MNEIAAITIRPAISDDADGIARVFIESAEHHARLDPERYFVPALDAISARYRQCERQRDAITLVADLRGEILGFVDARLVRSPDAMHRDMIYCHVSEIAVSSRNQSQGIGKKLLGAAQEWGRERGAEFSSLEYHAANVRAASFYQERMGYRVASITAIKRLQNPARPPRDPGFNVSF